MRVRVRIFGANAAHANIRQGLGRRSTLSEVMDAFFDKCIKYKGLGPPDLAKKRNKRIKVADSDGGAFAVDYIMDERVVAVESAGDESEVTTAKRVNVDDDGAGAGAGDDDVVMGEPNENKVQKTEYLIKWRGFDESAATWEPVENLTNAAIQSYIESKKDMVDVEALPKSMKEIRERGYILRSDVSRICVKGREFGPEQWAQQSLFDPAGSFVVSEGDSFDFLLRAQTEVDRQLQLEREERERAATEHWITVAQTVNGAAIRVHAEVVDLLPVSTFNALGAEVEVDKATTFAKMRFVCRSGSFDDIPLMLQEEARAWAMRQAELCEFDSDGTADAVKGEEEVKADAMAVRSLSVSQSLSPRVQHDMHGPSRIDERPAFYGHDTSFGCLRWLSTFRLDMAEASSCTFHDAASDQPAVELAFELARPLLAEEKDYASLYGWRLVQLFLPENDALIDPETARFVIADAFGELHETADGGLVIFQVPLSLLNDNAFTLCLMTLDISCWKCAKSDRPNIILQCDDHNCGARFHNHPDCLSSEFLLDEVALKSDDAWHCPNCRTHFNVKDEGTRSLTLGEKSSKKWGGGRSCSTSALSEVAQDLDPHHKGAIEGVAVGSWYPYRANLRADGVHRPLVNGIHGNYSEGGCCSIVVSGGYVDDHDDGDRILYTGEGGRDLSGNKRGNVPQSKPQLLTKGNLAMASNCAGRKDCQHCGLLRGEQCPSCRARWKEGIPIRVVRGGGKSHASKFCPVYGFRYDGLYKVVDYWPENGKEGFIVWRYLLQRFVISIFHQKLP